MRNWANRSESSDRRMHMIHLYQKLSIGKHPEFIRHYMRTTIWGLWIVHRLKSDSIIVVRIAIYGYVFGPITSGEIGV